MADIKLYQIKSGKAQIKSVIEFKYEREIQKLCEQNLETFFAIRSLATEYTTGNKHKGRIDTLGIDENNCPVIIEYKLVFNNKFGYSLLKIFKSNFKKSLPFKFSLKFFISTGCFSSGLIFFFEL